MSQVTHVYDHETGRMRQIVPPETLRQILRDDGDTLDRPAGWGPDDEWDVGPVPAQRRATSRATHDRRVAEALRRADAWLAAHAAESRRASSSEEDE